MGRAYELFTNSSGQVLTWEGVSYTAPAYTELPWGLGAWGAGSVRVCAPRPAQAQPRISGPVPCLV